MAPSRKRAKPSKPLASAVALWIEEQEATANLWLLVSEPDAPQQIRIPARRDFISHFSKIVNDLPETENSECPLIAFDAETVVKFCRACLPRLDALPPIGNFQKLCKLVKLAHFLDAPQLLDRWWAELQPYQPRAGRDFIAIFDLNLPGKTFTLNDQSLRYFPKAYLSLDETIKKKYEKKAYELFQLALEKVRNRDPGLYSNGPFIGSTDAEREAFMLYKMVKCLLEQVCPAST
mmetsp:Transcript_8619/g.27385  ORF Transcript_8619/g.27385 Transcript_8619/m.27385 type:complete len:234 (+) Transcript_8619:75-776(+)